MCLSGMALAKAGVGVHPDLTAGKVQVGTDFVVDIWITEAESQINARSIFDWTPVYDGLGDSTKKLLQQAASDLAAINCILYDFGNYFSRLSAEAAINILRDDYNRVMSLLKDVNTKKFIKTPSTGTID